MTEFSNELSENQINYLKKQKKHKCIVGISRILILFSFLFLWEFTANVGIIDSFIFSSPSKIALCFWGMVLDKSIFLHTNVTLYETILSFLLVTITSILVTILLWFSRRLSEILDPYLVVLNSLPKSALAPVLIVWLGNNMKTIITAAVSVAVFGSILTLYNGFLSMDPDQIRLIYTLGGKQKDVLTKVLLPGSVPLIISNMKVNIGLCLVGVIIGEFLSAQAGLGFLIIYGSQVFKLDLVIMSIVILCILSAILYQAVAVLERRCRQ